MPLRSQAPAGTHPQILTVLVACAAAMFLLGSANAHAGTEAGGGSHADAHMVADAMRTEHDSVAAYNDRRWHELRAFYAEDAIVLPPNHEPIRGRDAIVEYLRGLRDVAGPGDLDSFETVRVTATGTLANLVRNFTLRSGRIHLVSTAVYERQTDGSVLLGVDQLAFRERPAG